MRPDALTATIWPYVRFSMMWLTSMSAVNPNTYGGGSFNQRVSTSGNSSMRGITKTSESSVPNLQAPNANVCIRLKSPAPYAVVIAGVNAPNMADANVDDCEFTVLATDIAALTFAPWNLLINMAMP